MKSRALLPLVLLILSTVAVFAQKKDLKKANKLYESYQFAEAIPFYKAVLEKDTIEQAIIRLADCYKQTSKYKEAEYWYAIITKKGLGDPINRFNYGVVLKYNGKYDLAQKQFEDYAKLAPSDPRGSKMAYSCVVAKQLLNEKPVYAAKPATNLNTSYADFSPAKFQNGIVFASAREGSVGGGSSTRTGEPFIDLYYAKGNDFANLSKPVSLGSNLNTMSDEGPASFDASGKTMYFTKVIKIKSNPDLSNPNISVLKIYQAEYVENDWANVKELPFNSNSYSVGHPTVSADGNTMYFTSNMPGGFGGTDIYTVTKTDGKWGTPVNLGAEINTEGNEMFPYLHSDGLLYFASDLHPGLGGLDIFSAKKKGEKWGNVENLKGGVNSSFDDFGILFDDKGENGLLTSNRPGGTGGDDIFFIYKIKEEPVVVNPEKPEKPEKPENPENPEKPENPGGNEPNKGKYLVVTGSVVEALTSGKQKIDDAIVYLVKQQKQIGQATTDNKGEYNFQLEDKNSPYVLVAKKTGYFMDKIEFTATPDFDPSKGNFKIELEKIVLNQPNSRMPNTNFGFDSYTLSNSEKNKLDMVVQVLKENPEIRVELAGHTCQIGPEDYNMRLSRQRAEAVAQYLISKGISPNKLEVKGYGESKPVVAAPKNDNEFAVNRRTEFIVIGFDGAVPNGTTDMGNLGISPKPVPISNPDIKPEVSNPTKPVDNKPAPATPGTGGYETVDGTYYIVKKGDTLYSISKAFNTTVEKLMEVNGLKNITIVVGQKLKVK